MAITQQRIEQLLTAAEQINLSFNYNSHQTLALVERARQQLKTADTAADAQLIHSILITLISDLTQLHMDYQQQVATPQLTIAVEREHWRLTHKRNEYKRQWLADKRAHIPSRGRAQHIQEYQQIVSQQQSYDLAHDTEIDDEPEFYESSNEFAIPETQSDNRESDRSDK